MAEELVCGITTLLTDDQDGARRRGGGAGREVSPHYYLSFGILERSHLPFTFSLAKMPNKSVSILKMLLHIRRFVSTSRRVAQLEHTSASLGDAGGELIKTHFPGLHPQRV